MERYCAIRCPDQREFIGENTCGPSFEKALGGPGPGVYICDTCVNLCVEVIGQATTAEPANVHEWASLSDDELLQRIPFIAESADNIEAGSRERVHELRDRGVSWARIGAALGMTRQSAWERFSDAAT